MEGRLWQEVFRMEDLHVVRRRGEGASPVLGGVSFSMLRGQTLAMLGDRGSGKSILARCLVGLAPHRLHAVQGRLVLTPPRGSPLEWRIPDTEADVLSRIRGLVRLIPEDPFFGLNPLQTVGRQISDAVGLSFEDLTPEDRDSEVWGLFARVDLSGEAAALYPEEISAVARAKVALALAVVGKPLLLVADDPTRGLGVFEQSQVLGLIKELQEKLGFALLLTTRDAGVAAQMGDAVAVLYQGRIVEYSEAEKVMNSPIHPYAMGMVMSMGWRMGEEDRLGEIADAYPSRGILRGCPFHPRCPYAKPGSCDSGSPPLLAEYFENQYAACIRVPEIHASGVEGRE